MSIENEVKSEILRITGKPDQTDLLKSTTILGDIGYNEMMCRELEDSLRVIANRHATGKIIRPGSITPESTVSDCIGKVK